MSTARSDSSGPVCIITGGASGIGAATAVELARVVRAQLVLTMLPDDDPVPVVSAIIDAGGTAISVEADVRSAADNERTVAAALNEFGRIDLVHANAGFVDQSTIADGDPARWKRVIETNLLGVAYTVRAALPSLIEQRSGHVVFTASLSGRETYLGEPLYIASKWGVVGFGHALRQEVAPFGIRVTLIEPGLVDTPFTRDSPVIARLFDRTEPLRPEDVARAVVYAYLQPHYVNVNELALSPVNQSSLTDSEMRAALAQLSAQRKTARSGED
jgi:NADP-dependent 3-hydroxy acid dehydrogenase YdfG